MSVSKNSQTLLNLLMLFKKVVEIIHVRIVSVRRKHVHTSHPDEANV